MKHRGHVVLFTHLAAVSLAVLAPLVTSFAKNERGAASFFSAAAASDFLLPPASEPPPPPAAHSARLKRTFQARRSQRHRRSSVLRHVRADPASEAPPAVQHTQHPPQQPSPLHMAASSASASAAAAHAPSKAAASKADRSSAKAEGAPRMHRVFAPRRPRHAVAAAVGAGQPAARAQTAPQMHRIFKVRPQRHGDAAAAPSAHRPAIHAVDAGDAARALLRHGSWARSAATEAEARLAKSGPMAGRAYARGFLSPEEEEGFETPVDPDPMVVPIGLLHTGAKTAPATAAHAGGHA
mmetsp:Transcript_23726/g.68608  ORF Transcript_23726/g.68608 Transcript_23726/m.68608 type:complete len:296 (+) Transcript_23726:74-961(+)